MHKSHFHGDRFHLTPGLCCFLSVTALKDNFSLDSAMLSLEEGCRRITSTSHWARAGVFLWVRGSRAESRGRETREASLLGLRGGNQPGWVRGALSFRPRRVPQWGASASGGSRCPPSLATAAELAEKEERVVVWSCEAEEEQGNDEEHRDPPVTRPGCIEDDSWHLRCPVWFRAGWPPWKQSWLLWPLWPFLLLLLWLPAELGHPVRMVRGHVSPHQTSPL